MKSILMILATSFSLSSAYAQQPQTNPSSPKECQCHNGEKCTCGENCQCANCHCSGPDCSCKKSAQEKPK